MIISKWSIKTSGNFKTNHIINKQYKKTIKNKTIKMKLVWLSVLIVAIDTIPRIQSAPLEALESALEETLKMKTELEELLERQEADYLEKRRPKPHRIDPIELITQLQRYFLNSSNSSGNNSVWTIKQFEEKGFNMTHLLFKLNNSTLMNIVAEYFVKNGLDKYVIRDTSANSSMSINVPLILEDLSVIKAVAILIKSRVVPGPPRRRPIRHHQGGHERGFEKRNNNGGNSDNSNGRRDNNNGGGGRGFQSESDLLEFLQSQGFERKNRGGGGNNEEGGNGGSEGGRGGRGGQDNNGFQSDLFESDGYERRNNGGGGSQDSNRSGGNSGDSRTRYNEGLEEPYADA